MTNFIPIFPLEIVVFPGQPLNLHIFEERYKQLVRECVDLKKDFGIPAVTNGKVNEMGTLVEVLEVVKVYDDGKMDIKAEGKSIFRILEVIRSVPDKLYSGAIVNHVHNNMQPKEKLREQVLASLKEMHRLLGVTKSFRKPDNELLSYDLAPHAGLKLEEEYELLTLLREDQRMEYLKQHLQKVLPVITGTEELKNKIRLNGHFRELKGFNI